MKLMKRNDWLSLISLISFAVAAENNPEILSGLDSFSTNYISATVSVEIIYN